MITSLAKKQKNKKQKTKNTKINSLDQKILQYIHKPLSKPLHSTVQFFFIKEKKEKKKEGSHIFVLYSMKEKRDFDEGYALWNGPEPRSTQ